MQKKGSLYAEFCGSMAAEQGSEKFWIMIELSRDLQIISHSQRISLEDSKDSGSGSDSKFVTPVTPAKACSSQLVQETGY